jgi:hypothetical protein
MPNEIFAPAYGMPLRNIFEISITFRAKCLKLMRLVKMSVAVGLVFHPPVAFATSMWWLNMAR